MLTGCYPSRHGVLDNLQAVRDDVSSIARRLAAVGYATHAFASFFPITKAAKAQLGFARGGDSRDGSFTEARPRMLDEPQARWDDATEEAFVGFLRERPARARPFVAWVHFYDVHQPYAAPAPFAERFAGDYAGPLKMRGGASEAAFDAIVKTHLDEKMVARAPLAPDDAKYVVALYDGGIAAMDARFGRLLQALADTKLAADTVVVLTADHGEELGDHGAFWFHGNSVYDSVLRIPLIVRGPGIVAGRKVDLVQNVDLLPTLLELAGAPRSKDGGGMDGISFAPILRGRACAEGSGRQVAWSEWQHLILGARTDHWKYVLNPRGAHPKKTPYHLAGDPGFFIGCHELYDVAADPHETRDLWKERKDAVEELRQLAGEEYARRFAGLAPSTAVPSDPRDQERLDRLGYAAGEAGDYALDPSSCGDE
jgi:arylsulfatase A-like enzyme